MNALLGIDTSSSDLGVGLNQNGRPLSSFSRFVGNSHAEHITDAVTMLFKLNAINSSDITHIAVATGPGSFTGLRIGIAFVKGFCLGNLKKVLPVSTLHVLANAFKTMAGKKIFSALDARNNELFWACFHSDGKRITRLTEDTLSPAEKLLEASEPSDIIITDTMGFSKSTIFDRFREKRKVFSVEEYPVHRGYLIADIGALAAEYDAFWCNASEIKPCYLRPSYARRKEAG